MLLNLASEIHECSCASHKDTLARMDSPIYKGMFRSMQVSAQRKNNHSSIRRFKSFILNLEKNHFFSFFFGITDSFGSLAKTITVSKKCFNALFPRK